MRIFSLGRRRSEREPFPPTNTQEERMTRRSFLRRMGKVAVAGFLFPPLSDSLVKQRTKKSENIRDGGYDAEPDPVRCFTGAYMQLVSLWFTPLLWRRWMNYFKTMNSFLESKHGIKEFLSQHGDTYAELMLATTFLFVSPTIYILPETSLDDHKTPRSFKELLLKLFGLRPFKIAALVSQLSAVLYLMGVFDVPKEEEKEEGKNE